MPRIERLALLLALFVAGCDGDPRDCLLGFSRSDCTFLDPRATAFPQDDAICRGYGLVPGTADYATCRRKKAEVKGLTERETDRGVLQGPFLPSPPP